jgi:hypothetical protein
MKRDRPRGEHRAGDDDAQCHAGNQPSGRVEVDIEHGGVAHAQRSGKDNQGDGEQHGRKRQRAAGHDEDRRHQHEPEGKTEVMRRDDSRGLQRTDNKHENCQHQRQHCQ